MYLFERGKKRRRFSGCDSRNFSRPNSQTSMMSMSRVNISHVCRGEKPGSLTWTPKAYLSRCQQAIFGIRQICSLINQIFAIFPGNKHIALEQIISLAQQCKKEWKRKEKSF